MGVALPCTTLVAATTQVQNTKVILDCGATDHFFCNREFFTTFTEYYHEFQTGSGQHVPAYGYGDVVLNLVHENKAVNVFTIRKVSWAPALGHNLLSTIPLALKGVEVHLRKVGEPSQIWYEGKLQGLADIVDRQYVLRIQPPENPAQANFANTIPIVNAVKPTLELWHQRMGHLSYRSILRLPQLANGIDVKGPAPESVCRPCMQGRQRRKPSRIPMSRATKFLEKIHSDLCGPFPVSQNGMRSYISFKDDATGTYHVYPIKLKSEAFDKIKEHVEWASQETGMQLKELRTDGGGEYNNDDLKAWMKTHHVTWTPSAPYTPEQNGKAERLNLTLMSAVRSVLTAMKLPKTLWPEIVKTICYLKN